MAESEASDDRAGRAMQPEALRPLLFEIAEPVVADHGAELVDVEISGSGSFSLRLSVHRDSGVTVDLCEAISRELSDILDVEDLLPGRYRLEVTSPGLERPLQTDADFRRARQRRLKVITCDGRTEFGRLTGFTETTIELERKAGPRSVDRRRIARATIEVEF